MEGPEASGGCASPRTSRHAWQGIILCYASAWMGFSSSLCLASQNSFLLVPSFSDLWPELLAPSPLDSPIRG